MARDQYLRRLTPGQLRLYVALLGLSAYVVANAVYLVAVRVAETFDLPFLTFAPGTVSPFHQVMVLSHTAVGVLLVGVFAAFAWSHLRTMWHSNRRAAVISGVAMTAFGLTLAVTGLFILTAANSRDNAWVWWLHVALGLGAPALFVMHRQVSREPITGAAWWRRGALPLGALTVGMLLVHHVTIPVPHRPVPRGSERPTGLLASARDADRGLVLEGAFRPEILVPPGSQFFPSSSTTTTGLPIETRIIIGDIPPDRETIEHDLATDGFVHTALIGAESCARCHADTTAQWASSAHRFSSFNNPWYEATIVDMREVKEHKPERNPLLAEHLRQHEELAERAGVAKSNWCSGCHDPALMLAGLMNEEIDRSWTESQAGLTCQACHAIDQIHGVGGNGGFNVVDNQDDPYLFARAGGGLAMFLHDAALQAKPTAHKQQMLKDFHSTSEFCSTCHKVSLDQPVNDYRWFRGQNEYDAWHDSGISHNAARTFYLPPVARNCQDCHMPLEPAVLGDLAAKGGMVRSHHFAAANTALPFLRGDTTQIRRVEKMLRDSMRVEVFAVTGEDFAAEPVMSVQHVGAQVPAEEDVFVHVVVRNKGVGHTFPGGTNDSNEGWLELTAIVDGEEHVLSGWLDEGRHVDPWAHYFRAVIIDENSEKIHRRDAQNIRVAAYANVVGPGTADVARYRLKMPAAWQGRDVQVRARLLWRKFDQRYNEYAFARNPQGFAAFDAPPELPITEVATHQATVRVGERGTPVAPLRPATFTGEDWIRFNDYGIALVLDGDTVAAQRAFERVDQIAPARRDGPLNLARVALADGNIGRAFERLAEAEARDPGHAMIAYWWGRALQSEGSYERAINAYLRTLQDFPRDRDTMRLLGRTYYLDRQFEKSLETMDRVLEIDPEDRVAHYHRMLALRALGDVARAAIAEQAYAKYQIDESAREWVKQYALDNPADFLHSQPIINRDLRARLGWDDAPDAPPAPPHPVRPVETWRDPVNEAAAQQFLASLVGPAEGGAAAGAVR